MQIETPSLFLHKNKKKKRKLQTIYDKRYISARHNPGKLDVLHSFGSRYLMEELTDYMRKEHCQNESVITGRKNAYKQSSPAGR